MHQIKTSSLQHTLESIKILSRTSAQPAEVYVLPTFHYFNKPHDTKNLTVLCLELEASKLTIFTDVLLWTYAHAVDRPIGVAIKTLYL